MNDKQIWELIRSLTLEEKSALCGGINSWQTLALPEKGIPSLRMADGPHGVRREDKAHTRENGGPSIPATCFPPAAAMAGSWDTHLMQTVAAAMGAEARSQGVQVLLGPGANIKRSPLCGRNFEYFSEDPLLAGEMAAAWIQGVQSQGVGASLKHFAVNNQETKRMSISAAVDVRALFDIYLKPFEIAVKKAAPATVMASYNKIGGVYSCDNRWLLLEILRLRFGFKGLVMSDWGAEDKRDAGIAAGCDLEMPASHGAGTRVILDAIQAGTLSEDALDTAVWNVLRLVFRYTAEDRPSPCNYAAHNELAAAAAAKCAVLLKNEDAHLPFDAGKPLLVIGGMAENTHFQGGGSSIVNPKKRTNLLQALNAAGQNYTYMPGYAGYGRDAALVQNAAVAARNASQVLLVLGLPDLFDCESYDRTHLRLPDNQLEVLEAVAAANPDICVALCTGGALETPWLAKVRSLLCLYVGGQAVGEGARRVLFGLENPGGHLAESWPLALESTPCYHHYPMGPNEVSYNESLYVGYRYYNSADVKVQFPFGYGLSYTRFEYSELSLETAALDEGETLRVRFTLANTGDVAGDEVAQVYLSRPDSALYQPAHTLVGFARVSLAAGARQTVEIALPYARFAAYDPSTGTDVVEAGRYGLHVGDSSRSLPLSAQVQVAGVTLTPAAPFSKSGFYGQIQGNTFPAAAFEAIYQKPLLSNMPRQKGTYTMHTTLGEMHRSAIVRFFKKRALAVARKSMQSSQDPLASEKALRASTDDLPFKNLVSMSAGVVSPEAAETLLRAVNGKGGLVRALRMVLKSWKGLKRNDLLSNE